MSKDTRKLLRRVAARERLLAQIESGVKTATITDESGVKIEKVPLSEADTKRISEQIVALDFYISGGKKKKVVKSQTSEETTKDDKWFIDIYSIHESYVKRSERKKNKGKSTKKLKKVKSVNFVRSVVAHKGAMLAYREGKMGLSPKSHKFVMRKADS